MTRKQNLTQAGEYITLQQAAEQLGCHVATVRRYVKDGRLPAVRPLGDMRRLLIPRASLEAALAQEVRS